MKSDVRNSHYVGKDTGCRNCRTCAVTLDHHGILLVALGGEQEYVVAALQIVKGVILVHFA
jgi:hypothetical protein